MSDSPRTNRKSATKPVTETLLELAYYLHTTKVIGMRKVTSELRRTKPHGRPTKGEGSPLAG